MKIFFAPQYPDKEFYGLTHIINYLGYEVTIDPDHDCDVGYLWQDSTCLNIPQSLVNLKNTHPVINFGCTDISKINVDHICQQVFGYGSLLDPVNHKGLCVEKPNDNGVKGGHVIDCPVDQPRSECIYQQLIDSTIDGYQHEYRVPVILGTLPIVSLVKQVPATNALDHREQLPPVPMQTTAVFSAEEQQQILDFCQILQLDCGELDIVRCRHSQKLYILDANKTSGGYGMLNYFHWRRSDKLKVIAAMSKAFDHQLQSLIK